MTAFDPVVNLLAGTRAGYVIDGSAQLKAALSQYYYGTLPGVGDGTLWTYYYDGQKTKNDVLQVLFSAPRPGNFDAIYFDASNNLVVQFNDSTGNLVYLVTNTVYRDQISFMTICVDYNSNHVTPSERVVIKVNGVRITSFSSATYPSVSLASYIGTNVEHRISRGHGNATMQAGYFDGYIARTMLAVGSNPFAPEEIDINGYSARPTIANGISFGSNGFWFEGSTFGNDLAGSNDFTASGSPVICNNSPTNNDVNNVGLCPILNQLHGYVSINCFSNAGSSWYSNSNYQYNILSTLPLPGTGKWYWEFSSTGTATPSDGGVAVNGISFAPDQHLGLDAYGWTYKVNGNKYHNGSYLSYGAAWNLGDVIGVAFDADAGKLTFYKNGVSQGVAYTGLTSGPYWPAFHSGSSGTVQTVNFGATGAFAYGPPTGYKAFCTAHFDEPECVNPDTEYYCTTFSHTIGATTTVPLPFLAVENVMVRVKPINTSGHWLCFDTIRGNNKFVRWSASQVEDTVSLTDSTLAGNQYVHGSAMGTGTYFIEAFKVGSYFQIVTYTGTGANRTVSYPSTLSGGFGFLITFNRTVARGPNTQHVVLGGTYWAQADSASGFSTDSTKWNNTTATTTQVSLGTNVGTNESGQSFVMYVWANVGPYRFGTYIGNGNADGSVAWVGGFAGSWFNKVAGYTGNWSFRAKVLGSGNPLSGQLWMNTTDAMPTYAGAVADLLSTGFKHRYSAVQDNNSGYTYVFGAFGVRALRGPDRAQARAA